MKKIYFVFLLLGLINMAGFTQSYVSFPTGEAKWSQLNRHQIVWYEFSLLNYSYIQSGDTIIDNLTYSKMYYIEGDVLQYIGAIREDEIKKIYFYPKESFFSLMVEFPTNDREYLLYDFNDLYIGKVLTINEKEITVSAIDSIYINGELRKRYSVDGTGNWDEHWIEGIGSDHEFFSAYTYEFEWQNYTTCFTNDNQPPVFINTPYQYFWQDCEYYVGTNDLELDKISIFPNPTSDYLTLTTTFAGESQLSIYNCSGQLVMQKRINNQTATIPVISFPEGIYYLRLQNREGENVCKFVRR